MSGDKNCLKWLKSGFRDEYQKVGFKEFGRRRKSYFVNGKYYDDVKMDILAEEFTENYIKNKNV